MLLLLLLLPWPLSSHVHCALKILLQYPSYFKCQSFQKKNSIPSTYTAVFCKIASRRDCLLSPFPPPRLIHPLLSHHHISVSGSVDMAESLNNERPDATGTTLMANLNSPSIADESFSLDPDLSLYTNTEFYDFDSGQNTDFQPQATTANVEAPITASPADLTSTQVHSPSLGVISDFFADIGNINFNIGDLASAYPLPQMPATNLSSMPSINVNVPAPSPAPAAGAPGYTPTFTRPAATTRANVRRETDSSNVDRTPEEQSRVAAEEDKRRRNTAASARFRVKKKQREQALERSAKELTEKNQILEQRVQQLETECKWLRNLLTEKTGDSSVDFAKLFKVMKEGGSTQSAGKKQSKRSTSIKEEEVVSVESRTTT